MIPVPNYQRCIPREALKALERVHLATVDPINLNSMLRQILDEILEIFDCDRAWLIHPCRLDASHIDFALERTRPDWPRVGWQDMNIPICDVVRKLLSTCLNSDGPVRLDPLSSPLAKSHDEAMRAFQNRSQLVVALSPNGDEPWALGISHCGQAHVYECAVPLFQAISNRVTDAIGAELTMRGLRQSEERFRTLVEHAPEAITMIDVDTGLYVDANPMAEALHKLPRDGLIGKFGPADLSPKCQPDGRLSSEAAPQYLGQALAGEFPKFEWLHMDSNGRETLCEVRLARLPDPRRSLVRASISDITERKAAEETLRRSESNYRNILDKIQETFYRTDLNGSIVMASPSAEFLLGHRIDELVGKKLADFYVHPEDRAEFLSELEGSGGQVIGYEAPLRHKDGHEVWVSTNAHYFYDDDGKVFGVEGTARDISDRKRVEREILRAKESAESASNAKSQFLANMSHELRTPLNAILGFSEIMATESFGPLGSEKYKEYANDIHSSGTLLLDLISDVLDLSRIEAGALDLTEGAVNLNEALYATLRVVRERAERKSLRINTNFDPSTPIVIGDERAIKQIALNLLSNCTKFTSEGGTVTVSSETDPHGRISLAVADTGIGIAAADIPKVLEPFGQIGNASTREHEGTGLGLPFAKKLAELHNAAFELKSELGVGTTVTVRFPPERRLQRNNG
jgi:PAS domain S-box-containing protein